MWCLRHRGGTPSPHTTLVSVNNSVGQTPAVLKPSALYFCTSLRRLGCRTLYFSQAWEHQCPMPSLSRSTTQLLLSDLATILGAVRVRIWVTAASLLFFGREEPNLYHFLFLKSPLLSRSPWATSCRPFHDFRLSYETGHVLDCPQLQLSTMQPASLRAREPHNFATCLKWGGQKKYENTTSLLICIFAHFWYTISTSKTLVKVISV